MNDMRFLFPTLYPIPVEVAFAVPVNRSVIGATSVVGRPAGLKTKQQKKVMIG